MSMSALTRRGGYLSTVEQAEMMDKKQDGNNGEDDGNSYESNTYW